MKTMTICVEGFERTFTVINKDTKRAESILYRYNNSRITSIYKAYERPSEAKQIAFYDLQRIYFHLNGEGLRIIGASNMEFSLGCRLGNALAYETKYDSYIIPNAFE